MNRAAGCAILLALSLPACAASQPELHSAVPRNSYGEPILAKIDPKPAHRGHGSIYVPAGPPIQTVTGQIVPFPELVRDAPR